MFELFVNLLIGIVFFGIVIVILNILITGSVIIAIVFIAVVFSFVAIIIGIASMVGAINRYTKGLVCSRSLSTWPNMMQLLGAFIKQADPDFPLHNHPAEPKLRS